jgi:hypothetical protein
MTATKWIGLLLGAGVVYWIYNKSIFANSLSYYPTRLKVGGSILKPQIDLGVEIVNKSNINTTFSNLNSELFLENGQKVADVYFNEKIVIPANSSVKIVLIANTTFSNLANSVAELISSKNANFKIKGFASVDNIKLPFTIDYKFFG